MDRSFTIVDVMCTILPAYGITHITKSTDFYSCLEKNNNFPVVVDLSYDSAVLDEHV